MQGSKVSVVYQMHGYSVILFETVKVTVAMALIHLCFGGDSPLRYVKNKVLSIFFAATPLSSKMITLNVTTILKDFSQYIYKYMVLKICFLKYFEPCIKISNKCVK